MMTIQYWVLGSNPRPLERESPPLTTRPVAVIRGEHLQITFWNCFFKLGQPRTLFHLFSSFQTQIITIFTTIKCEQCHVHPLYGAGIRTHDLWIMSLLP